jgi:hypothetical protein
MGFLRAIFLFALVMLVIGIVGTHYLLANLFGPSIAPASAVAVAVHKATPAPKHRSSPTATASPTKVPARATSTRTATPPPATIASPTPVPTIHVVISHHTVHHQRHRIVRRTVATVKPTATAKPLPSATPTPTSGTVTLTSYWVGSTTAQPGQTVSIGYVIDNGTGHTARITLGASIKSSHVINWLSGQINDPYHDVVATVPPGVSTHVRYFTLPNRLHAGTYDVAWGLRNALSGGREALVAAPDALRVRG